MPLSTACRLLVLGTLLGSAAVQAQLTQAAHTGVVTLYPCPSFCGGPGGRFNFDIDGGEGFTFSSASLSTPDGSGRASAALAGPTLLPVLKAEAYTPVGGNSHVDAEATAMQGFYLGAGSLGSYSLTVTLTGSTNHRLATSVYIFKDADPTSPAPYSSSEGSLFFEMLSEPEYTILASGNADIASTGTPQSASFTLLASGLATGDLIYVWARLEASGRHGGWADGYNTLNMAFANDVGLSQTAPVPEPATWGLLALGLLAGGVLRRRGRLRPMWLCHLA